jgi:hypothetical protein
MKAQGTAMTIEEVKTYGDLEGYLREFVNFGGGPVPYDFNGAFRLFLALLDNLTRNHLDADIDGLEEDRPRFTEDEMRFLKKLERLA